MSIKAKTKRKAASRKIVALKFDDGTEAKFSNIFALMVYVGTYVETLPTQEWLRELAGSPIDWSAQEKRVENRQARKLKNRANALALRRKDVTKADLISFRGKFGMAHNGKTFGWKMAACAHFNITLKTLNDRMQE